MAKERSAYMDYVKGLLIFLVIFGHMLQYVKYGRDIPFWFNLIFKYIYIFHMPLFIAISGYYTYFSLKKDTVTNYLKSRFVILFIPLVSWSIIISVVEIFIKNNFDTSFILLNTFDKIATVYWFIWAIIIYSVIIGFAKWAKLDNIYFLIPLSLIILFAHLDLNPGFVYVLGLAKSMFPFFIIGYLLARFDISKLYLICKKYIVVILVLACTFAYFWGIETYIYRTPSSYKAFSITVFRLFASCAMSVAFMTITYHVYNLLKDKYSSRFLSAFGKETLPIYLIQCPVFFLYSETIGLNRGILPGYSILYIIPSIILLFATHYIIQLLDKNKTTAFLLLGKKKK